MVQFAKEYPEFPISQQVVGQIPWGHNILLLQRLDNLEDRLWYAHMDMVIMLDPYGLQITRI